MSEEPGSLAGRLEQLLLGGEPCYTRRDLVERAELPLETAEELWRALGFAHVGDDQRIFTQADLEALKSVTQLFDAGIVDRDSSTTLVRSWGRSFARLAEWQATLFARVAAEAPDPEARVGELADDVIPLVASLQEYVWRRHLMAASGRLLDRPEGDAPTRAVGFVDIVGYTSTSQHLDESELLALVEGFESTASSTVVEHGGQLIKTIGDEVLFVVDDPVEAVRVARVLSERHAEDEEFPEVRAGVAYGAVYSRLGDVYGSTVNLASRLTSLARPGTVLADGGAHEALTEADPDEAEFRLRRIRRASVKGYHHVEAWRVKRPRKRDEG
ncbi:adenylate/guanylate cyclase domain-containing protein [Marmoricola endophyticus]|uniref:Adenylate/guanylate cyclase domain-containing protein n=1 Tax=Marmoricola endophyticus TaxID=2040280 RepID=A0A917BKE8_9ACTN|nr:adenylate/guanylate cyclase domain-containing protein [Marmoricola endophyticus]GGF46658.1 adenylate/guanylate cyclase domain-containing protein [Marmoricola endophyticus]